MPAYIIEVVHLSYSTKLSSLICGTSIGNNLVHKQSSINSNSWLHLQIRAGTDEDNHQKCTSYTIAFIHASFTECIKLKQMHDILGQAYIIEHCKCWSCGSNKQQGDCKQGRQRTQCLAATLAPWIHDTLYMSASHERKSNLHPIAIPLCTFSHPLWSYGGALDDWRNCKLVVVHMMAERYWW